MIARLPCCALFFFNDTATTEIYTLSLHDALPIYGDQGLDVRDPCGGRPVDPRGRPPDGHRARSRAARGVHLLRLEPRVGRDRKSTRLNSSHAQYLVCRLLLDKNKKPAAAVVLWST